MKKTALMKLIREEVELILTNEEVSEMFDVDPAEFLDEMCGGEEVSDEEPQTPPTTPADFMQCIRERY